MNSGERYDALRRRFVELDAEREWHSRKGNRAAARSYARRAAMAQVSAGFIVVRIGLIYWLFGGWE